MEAKGKLGDKFTKAQQKELDEATEAIVDLEEQIELAPDDKADAGKAATVAAVAKGTEKMVQLELSYGVRYDSKTGKEINHPVKQSFTFGEWQLFKKNYKRLGYTIVAVINDPYNDATELIDK